MADMVDKINALLNDVAGRIRLKPTEMIVPIATVQKVADEQGVTVEVAKEYLREMARQLMWSTGTIGGDGLDLIGENDGHTPDP